MSDERIEATIEATIEKLIPGGEGLARIDGMAHFIPGCLPGERVRAEVVQRKKGWARTGAPEILEASPDRREPFCPLYDACGGCSWQHIDYALQVRTKGEFAREALVRLGGLSESDIPEIITVASPPRGYRARIRPVILEDGRAAFRSMGSDRLIPIDHCPVASAGINRFLASPPKKLVPGTEPVVFGTEEYFRVDGVHKKAEAVVAGRTFRFPPKAFFQSNLLILDQLLDFALSDSGSAGKDSALDLYGGVGLFGAFLSDRFAKVIGVDRDAAAAGSWRNHVGPSGEFHRMSLEKWMRKNTGASPDFIIVDPPRGGLSADVRGGIIALKAAELSYVSCSPDTQARDLKEFFAAGYKLDGYRVFDMYPQTPHVEVVARLTLNRGGKAE